MTAAFVGKRPETIGVNQLMRGSAMQAFLYWIDNWSDIQEHLGYLMIEAHGNVVELGVRGGISTAALLSGVERHGGAVVSIDVDHECGEAFQGHPKWTFIEGTSLGKDTLEKASTLFGHCPTKEFIDLLFIDTEHTHAQLKRELRMWSPFVKAGGKIVMHDVLSFPHMGTAAQEFADENNLNYTIRPGSNGLGVLKI